MISKFKNIIKELYFDSKYKPNKVLFYLNFFTNIHLAANIKYTQIAILYFNENCPISIKEYFDKTIYFSKPRMKDI